MSYNPEDDVNSEMEDADSLSEDEKKSYKETEDDSKFLEPDTDIGDDTEFVEPYADSSLNIEEQTKTSNKKGLLFDLLFYAMLIFVCIYIIPNYVLQRTVVDGTSMENTLHNGDQLYVEKISYHLNALKRFDIIVFYPYGKARKDYYVKRIIGLPGETVQIIGSNIFINGKVLKEKYGKDPITDPGRAAEPIKLADDEYFVLGDNRSVSKDSRSEEVANVKRNNIGGRVILRIKPLNKFGPVD